MTDMTDQATLQAQIEALALHLQDLEQRHEEELAKLREARQRQRLQRMAEKIAIMEAPVPTVQEHRAHLSICSTCTHAELVRSCEERTITNPRYARGISHREPETIQVVSSHTLTLCGAQHMRPIEYLTTHCTMYQEEPGLQALQDSLTDSDHTSAEPEPQPSGSEPGLSRS